MKKFIIKAGIIGLLPFIILFIGYLVVPVRKNDYERAYITKINRLENLEKRKLIFVGGSNLAFGLDSERIQDSLNIDVINYGLSVQLGLKFMIDDVSLYINDGDILVIAPEWQHYYSFMYGKEEYLSMIFRLGYVKKIRLLNMRQYSTVLLNIPAYLKRNILHQTINDKTYLASNFNEYGDEEKHWSLKNDYKSNPQPITDKFDTTFGKYFIDKLNELQTKCTVIMIPPATCNVAMKKWAKQVNEVENYLKRNGHPFIIDPDSCSFGEKYMYDSDYHLNKKGVDIRTSLVIDALKKV